MAAALLTRAARGGALSVGARAARAAAAAAAISTAGALSGGRGAASSLARAGASRSMSTTNGHGAVESRCSCEREILELRKELLDESRRNQALYRELAEQSRFVRELVTIKAEATMAKNSYSLLASVAAFVFAMVTFGAPYAEDVWRQRTMEAMEERYGLVAIPRGRVAGTLPHLEGGSAAAPPSAALAPHGEADKKQGPK